jgi:thiosulfate/3-mercaptopyruvate sulfurtransferase
VLASTEWLASHLHGPDLVVVDLRWREDGSGRAEFEQAHIPGAVFIDWATDLIDAEHRVAFMLAPPEAFAATLQRFGIGDQTDVVAYADHRGSGPYRLWWACRVYGNERVRVLDGGFEKWQAEGRPVERGATRLRPAVTRFTPGFDPRLVARREDVEAARTTPRAAILDSRPPEQFRGEAVWFETGPIAADPDGIARTPRGEIRAGRIPRAANVPAAALYHEDSTMKTREELRAMFAEARVTASSRAITYCGVGLSAAALTFALKLAGVEDVALYDASWEEWGRDTDGPIARG